MPRFATSVEEFEVDELPEDDAERKEVLAKRSRPNPTRPRLSDDLEKKLEPIEKEHAAAYEDLDEVLFQLSKVGEEE